jgi:hypothetical protein
VAKTSTKGPRKPPGQGRPKKPKRPAHRPSEYTPERGAEICEQMAQGKSLHSILQQPGMPDRMTVVRWLASYEDFRAIYAHAREVGLDHFAELTLAEAEDETAPEKSQLARLKWDARRWHLSKMLPRKYGERITQEHIGADGAPIGVNALVANLTPPQIAAGIRALLIKTATDMGLPMLPKSASDADRVSAIINSGKVLPPPMYSIIHGEMPPALALSWV